MAKKKDPKPELTMKYLNYLREERTDYKEWDKWVKGGKKGKKPENPKMAMSGSEFFEIFIIIVVLNFIQDALDPEKGIKIYTLIVPLTLLVSGLIYLGYKHLTKYNFYKEIAMTKELLPHVLWSLSILVILLLNYFGFL